MIKFVSTLTFCFLFSNSIYAGDQVEALKDLANTKFKAWLNNATVVDAVKSQNAANKGLSEAQIEKLDKQWRAETDSSSKPLIEKVVNNDLSKYLAQVKEKSAGLYTEIFVMDNLGLNVGQSDVTSDYWQGDEAKWKKTFLLGPNAIHVSDIEMDESTQQFQAQVSLTVTDPKTNKAIGAVTVGINVDEL